MINTDKSPVLNQIVPFLPSEQPPLATQAIENIAQRLIGANCALETNAGAAHRNISPIALMTISQVPQEITPEIKAAQLVAFFNALPETLNKPQIPTNNPILAKELILEWMHGTGKAAIEALEELRLGNCHLTALPPEIGLFCNLRFLFLDHNQLPVLPQEIGQLSALQELSLSSNQLKAIPPEIGKLGALEMLILYHNQLAKLPQEIGQLRTLNWLSLSRNQLTTIPAEIGQLNALRVIFLKYSQLQTLPDSIFQLSADCIINAQYNRFTPGCVETLSKHQGPKSPTFNF